MGKTLTLVGIALGIWTLPVSAEEQTAQSAQDVLIDLERGWNDAVYRQDADFVDNLLAEEFVVTYDAGTRADRSHELQLITEFNQAVESATQENFTVRIYGETAVVWFTLRLAGYRQGELIEILLNYTDVWVMRDGRWQCVSSQSTRVREP